jgi:prepilin-type N-terminal cleavage/methylation domain-containing protein
MDARRVLTGRAGQPRNRRPRRGMTLMEVMIAVTILTTALIGMGNFMGTFSHATKTAALQQRAIDLATDRIDSVKRAPTFVSIDSMAVTETIHTDSADYKRQTLVQHVGGGSTDTLDYRTVTVQVTAPTVTTPIRKTTIIGAF